MNKLEWKFDKVALFPRPFFVHDVDRQARPAYNNGIQVKTDSASSKAGWHYSHFRFSSAKPDRISPLPLRGTSLLPASNEAMRSLLAVRAYILHERDQSVYSTYVRTYLRSPPPHSRRIGERGKLERSRTPVSYWSFLSFPGWYASDGIFHWSDPSAVVNGRWRVWARGNASMTASRKKVRAVMA